MPPVLAAANELERLHDEFDLADAAGTELHVVGQVAPRDFLLDERLHLTQALEHAEVEIAAVDERPHALAVDQPVRLGTGDRARLDPRVALPVAAMGLQIVVEEGRADRQRAAVAEGPQPHVDAEHEALGRALAEQPDDAAGRAA